MKGSQLPEAVDCAMQRLLDAAQARKTGHGNRPSFLSWDDGTRPGMPPDQERLALIKHQERLSQLRIAATNDQTMLSLSNYKKLGQLIQDTVQRIGRLKDVVYARTLEHYIGDVFKAQHTRQEWAMVVQEAIELQRAATEQPDLTIRPTRQ